MSDIAGFADPYGQPGRGGPSTLTDMQPPGFQLELNPDGSAEVIDPSQMPPGGEDHFANLAEGMDETRLNTIATELLDAIEQDKESREERDRQYEEGLNRTGLGNNAPGGATFPGASRVVHPLLTEASIDFSARVMSEMLPPDGPVKGHIIGDENDAKNERAKRIARYMNWQLTELMTSAYHEFEMGFTQCPLGGAFYTKTYLDNSQPAVSFIPIDQVYRPWSDGDFYSQPRITHAQSTDIWTFKENVRKKLWRDVVDPATAADTPEETRAERANDRIIGRSETTENIDSIRMVYETSVIMPLDSDEDEDLPYLVTIDTQSRKVLAIYRNWKEEDPNHKRLTFLIEWPFWPWRGGYPIGLTHMIGGLSGASTGALRALMDAAHLNNSQTGVQLKGGATAGGQNLTPRVTEISMMQGSLAQDDIRKTYMPIPFNPPSPVLFNLLGFLVDAGRGVVRTTFDEYDKFGGQTPVGTAQMFIEQGLKNFGAVHARLHRSMRLFLKGLYDIDAATLTNETIIDQQGELTVSQQDFQGPMVVIPVSDPRIFSDLQRKAMAQTIAARATSSPVMMQIYDVRAAEENFLRTFGVSNPERYLVKIPQPQRQNAVAENVTASNGQPIKAFPGQDHMAHIELHMAYLESPIFGSNPSLAVKYCPQIVNHLGEHISLWYSDAMLEAATVAVRELTKNPQLTLESFIGLGTEVPLDRLMLELSPEVMKLAQEKMESVPAAIMRARDLMKSLAPPTPMDPSVVAQEDVQRQREKDQSDTRLKVIDFQARREKEQEENARKERESQGKLALQARDQDMQAENEAREAQIKAAQLGLEADRIESEEVRNEQDNETAIEITEMNNDSRVEAAKEAAKGRAKAGGGGGNLKNGTALGRGPNPSG